ncbi:microneme protein mic11 [Cystoisospora suis]|uniref:Microneme protein mic11 n=1 Tax=Cystoisospora suis TaxID=483139 RepID=A0A2C6KUW4_9APIC|nr:microneme protein mic11 [Cystoisospora suis]
MKKMEFVKTLLATACLAFLLTADSSTRVVSAEVVPVSFGQETARAELLNKVSRRVFSLLETEGPSDDGSTSAILKGAFKGAVIQVLRAVKGEVAKTCDELALLAERKIKEKEAAAEVGGAVSQPDESDEFDFSFLDSAVTESDASIRPHGFLEEKKFMDTLKSMAKDAMRSLAGSFKDVLVNAIRPLLPRITESAVKVFKQACEEAEERVQEA